LCGRDRLVVYTPEGEELIILCAFCDREPLMIVWRWLASGKGGDREIEM
jgi:hypothetical protein